MPISITGLSKLKENNPLRTLEKTPSIISLNGLYRRSPSAVAAVGELSPAVTGKTTWNFSSDGPLILSTNGTWTFTPSSTIKLKVKMWGAGGGVPNYGAGHNGGGGGYSNGSITFLSGTTYELIVGQGGSGVAANRNAGAGGGGTGIQFSTGSVPILVAGGGGGGYSTTGRRAGAGGGSSGQAGDGAGGGGGGTQSAPGSGGVSSRRTGAAGSGRNGGQLNTGTFASSGGTGFGKGGDGAYNGGDAGSGGGGGGYYGGGEGGGDVAAFGGGGGSGYINVTYVENGVTIAGNYEIPANNSDADRGTAGSAGEGSNSSTYSGKSGLIRISL
jgi:hypothetical protein